MSWAASHTLLDCIASIVLLMTFQVVEASTEKKHAGFKTQATCGVVENVTAK